MTSKCKLLGLVFIISIFYSCKNKVEVDNQKQDIRLNDVKIHKNEYFDLVSKPEVLVDKLNNPAAPFQIGKRIIFAESAEGRIVEYSDNNITPLIKGFGLDNYAGYEISILGITSDLQKEHLIVAASEDEGHIYAYKLKDLPVRKDENIEIPIERVESANPFSVLITDAGKTITATGGTKAAYQGNFDLINPSPLIPIFEVATGIAGLSQDVKTGMIYGAVIGSGQKDGSIVRWNSTKGINVEPETISEGFSNLVDLHVLPNGLLLALEFGDFGVPSTGALKIIDLKNPQKQITFITGLDSPSGISLNSTGELMITTFGKKMKLSDGMLTKFTLKNKRN